METVGYVYNFTRSNRLEVLANRIELQTAERCELVTLSQHSGSLSLSFSMTPAEAGVLVESLKAAIKVAQCIPVATV
ncbi:MAG: hypothetical protein K0Q92_641 [Steroidobacteraceae bacterium]|jgi:hypothetical protein|nr:hypothetical protein [Steroidobacteraceae bacterium]